jgi:hypothetical protein
VLSERLTYDADLDEAEDLLDVADTWSTLHADRTPKGRRS